MSKILERLSRASGQVRALERLVNDLLDVSRMTAGKLILHPESVDLTQLVDEVVSQYAEAAQKMGCPVEVHAAERVVGQWDRARMEQVITNLLSNALKYGRGKAVEIEVSHDSGKAILRVQDYGIGIDAANLTRIFDRFERAVSEREFGGLGLGLWIVRRIVEESGGLGEGAERAELRLNLRGRLATGDRTRASVADTRGGGPSRGKTLMTPRGRSLARQIGGRARDNAQRPW